MKAIVLCALIVAAAAFDFPEEWEAWKKVSITYGYCYFSNDLWLVRSFPSPNAGAQQGVCNGD